MKIRLGRMIILSFAIGALVGCSPSHEGSEDLRQFVAAVKERPAKPLPPLPAFPPVTQFNYAASKLHSPFKPQLSANHLPNGMEQHHVTEPLERFSLDSLNMVGVLSRDNENWALILAPDGKTYQVNVGSYIGQNLGKVVSITNDQVNIIEMISDGESWTKRPAVLKLISSKSGNQL